MSKHKATVDIAAIILSLAAIITGFMLHKEVWHLHLYDNTFLWGIHEVAGLGLLLLVTTHCLQHSFWFKNYSKLKVNKKRVTTILLIVGMIVVISGIMLMCGSHSELVSHLHYAVGLLFIALAIGHVSRRWKILKSLL